MSRHFAITRAQREALFKVFQRDFPSWVTPTRRYGYSPRGGHCAYSEPLIKVSSLQWRTFRRRVLPSFGCDGMITIHWRGMWLAIERDGYTHS
jgi:hypothetical protein